jgi:hypothetical protein
MRRCLDDMTSRCDVLLVRGFMIKSELISRIAEQNPHLFTKDVERSSMPFLTRSEPPWLGGIEWSCVSLGHSLSRHGRLGQGVIQEPAPRSVSIRHSGQAKRCGIGLMAPQGTLCVPHSTSRVTPTNRLTRRRNRELLGTAKTHGFSFDQMKSPRRSVWGQGSPGARSNMAICSARLPRN